MGPECPVCRLEDVSVHVRDAPRIVDLVQVEASRACSVGVVQRRAGRTDRGDRSRDRSDAAPDATVQVSMHDDPPREPVQDLAQLVGIRQPVERALDPRGRVEDRMVQRDNRGPPTHLLVLQDAHQGMSWERPRWPAATSGARASALESPMMATGPRSFTKGNRPAGTETRYRGRSLAT